MLKYYIFVTKFSHHKLKIFSKTPRKTEIFDIFPFLGTFTPEAYSNEAVVCALTECGIRHIDTARMYKTEALIQKSIKDSGVPREELFIVSKAWPTQYGSDGIRKSLRKSLTELGVDYIGKIWVRISMSRITRPPRLSTQVRMIITICHSKRYLKVGFHLYLVHKHYKSINT